MPRPSADVAIIGAGLLGMATAWRLAQAGVKVQLWEAGTVGCGASSAGAGMLSPGGEFDKPSPWVSLGIESMRLYPQFVAELQAETRVPIDFQICGCQLTANPEDSRRVYCFQTSAGIRVERTSNALFYPDDGLVDPAGLLLALRAACEQRGVPIHERQPRREVEAEDYGALVVAAGAWSDQLSVRFRKQVVRLPQVKPIKGHLIGFQLAAGTLGSIRRQGHTYVLQRRNGFVVAGSTEEDVGFNETVDEGRCAGIHNRAADLLPELRNLQPSRKWIGFRPQSEGGLSPHIEGVAGTNVWLAYGHYRNGILLAPLTAQRVTEGICR